MTDHPKNLRISDFSYQLPEDKIAGFPLEERDASRLLIYKNGDITEDIYRNIAGHLPPDSLLVFNNTKVVQARILFRKPTGGAIEIFALEPHSQYKDVTTAMLEKSSVRWQCLVGGAAKWKNEQVLTKQVTANGINIELKATLQERNADSFTIQFDWLPASWSFSEVLSGTGTIPIPPYLKREAALPDTERYQTIYAKHDGSVAAPTAGLHFTNAIFESLRSKNIQHDFVTLHVGAGTFMPVKTENMEGHPMHEEFIEVGTGFINRLIAHPSVFCVGTTSLRTLESLYWMGVKCILQPSITYSDLAIKQWDVYESLDRHSIGPAEALKALLNRLQEDVLEQLVIKTQILIAPGYTFRIAKGLITNFHQPQSTLLLLVAALIGDDWKKVYQYALDNDFRFLSYGDGSLLFLH